MHTFRCIMSWLEVAVKEFNEAKWNKRNGGGRPFKPYKHMRTNGGSEREKMRTGILRYMCSKALFFSFFIVMCDVSKIKKKEAEEKRFNKRKVERLYQKQPHFWLWKKKKKWAAKRFWFLIFGSFFFFFFFLEEKLNFPANSKNRLDSWTGCCLSKLSIYS